MRNEMPAIKKILFWSDGSASQYKKFKNLVNLSFHESDFGKSHGKSPCDGIGGMVKR